MDELHDYQIKDPKKMQMMQTLKEVGIMIFATLLYSISTYIFVLGNNFAPSGFSGILAIISYCFDLQIGSYALLAMNIPLLIWAYFSLDKRFVAYTTLNVVILCGSLFLLGFLDKNGVLKFNTKTWIPGNEIILGGETVQLPGAWVDDFGKKLFCSIISGILAGISIALTFRYDGSLGGVDIIIMIIQKKKPRSNVSILLFSFNAMIIVMSYFAFKDPQSICFAVIYILIFSKVTEYILKGVKQALKFEVITQYPEELSAELIKELGHSVTVTHVTGMFEHKDKYLLLCVIRSRQISDFEKILKKYPDTFAFASSVSEVFGVFFK